MLQNITEVSCQNYARKRGVCFLKSFAVMAVIFFTLEVSCYLEAFAFIFIPGLFLQCQCSSQKKSNTLDESWEIYIAFSCGNCVQIIFTPVINICSQEAMHAESCGSWSQAWYTCQPQNWISVGFWFHIEKWPSLSEKQTSNTWRTKLTWQSCGRDSGEVVQCDVDALSWLYLYIPGTSRRPEAPIVHQGAGQKPSCWSQALLFVIWAVSGAPSLNCVSKEMRSLLVWAFYVSPTGVLVRKETKWEKNSLFVQLCIMDVCVNILRCR